MKKTFIAVCALLVLAACSSAEGEKQADTITMLTQRIERLEKKTNSLERGLDEARQGLAAIEEGLAVMREKGVRVETSPDRDGSPVDDKTVTKEELDEKARSFAGESLDRMLDLSRTVLDKIEQELQSMENENRSAPDSESESSSEVRPNQEKEI